MQFDGSPESVAEPDNTKCDIPTFESIHHCTHPIPPLPITFQRKNQLSRSLSGNSSSKASSKVPPSEQPTILHRPNLRVRPTLPKLDTNLDRNPRSLHEAVPAIIAHSTSSSPSAYNNSMSPESKASTGQTSLFMSSNSVKSQRSVETRPPEHYQPVNRSFLSWTEELAPIEESGTSYLTIPCQEAHIDAKPSIKTVEAATAAKIFFEIHFNSLLSDSTSPRSARRQKLDQKLREFSLGAEARQLAYREWARIESDHLRQTRVLKSTSLARHEVKGISIAGYEAVRVLGKGSFGIVRLVKEANTAIVANPQNPNTNDNSTTKNHLNMEGSCQSRGPQRTKDVYAMKVIRKSEMLRNCQEGHLRAERDILVQSEGSRWIVPLIASFQDNTNLYLVMDYMIGGDFLGMLLREDMLDEWAARWYIAEMILCIEEAHKMKWIHRDVKPDNFLISSSGHLKISDFGLAFDGHWSHSQSYYSNHRYSLLEKLGIKVRGDNEDVQEDAKVRTTEMTSGKANRKTKPDADDAARREEGLLNWRDRTERKMLARSIVGTSQYMAPEVILGQQYDGRCD